MARKSPDKPTSDRGLMRSFLEKFEGWSGPAIERAVPGVSQSDVSRWRNDDWTWLSDPKREAIKIALRGDHGLPEHYKRQIKSAALSLRQTLAELDALAGESSEAQKAETRLDPETSLPPWAAVLVELTRGADTALPHHPNPEVFGAERSVALAAKLRKKGELTPADEMAWAAYKMGKAIEWPSEAAVEPWSGKIPLDPEAFLTYLRKIDTPTS